MCRCREYYATTPESFVTKKVTSLSGKGITGIRPSSFCQAPPWFCPKACLWKCLVAGHLKGKASGQLWRSCGKTPRHLRYVTYHPIPSIPELGYGRIRREISVIFFRISPPSGATPTRIGEKPAHLLANSLLSIEHRVRQRSSQKGKQNF